ncbi:MAG: hypothetical protein WC763_00805 [Candidatus Paceibacterota bacterium]|jgi:hypothetical protein
MKKLALAALSSERSARILHITLSVIFPGLALYAFQQRPPQVFLGLLWIIVSALFIKATPGKKTESDTI